MTSSSSIGQSNREHSGFLCVSASQSVSMDITKGKKVWRASRKYIIKCSKSHNIVIIIIERITEKCMHIERCQGN